MGYTCRDNGNIVAYRPVAGQGPQSEQQGNGCCLVMAGKHINTRAIARQLLSKRVPATKDTHATVEELLEYNNRNGVFYVVRAEML
jgi:hypothetical protein